MQFQLDHIHLRCQDLEAAVNFYEKMFGGRVTARLVVRERQLVQLKIGDNNLFLSPQDAGAVMEPLSDHPRWGVYELSFRVADTYQAVTELKAKGAEFLQEAFEVQPGIQVAFMKAPDGMRIEIIHRD